MLNRVESLIQLPVCQKRRRLGLHKLTRIFAVSLPESTADCVFQLNHGLETQIQLSRQSRTPTQLNGEAKMIQNDDWCWDNRIGDSLGLSWLIYCPAIELASKTPAAFDDHLETFLAAQR